MRCGAVMLSFMMFHFLSIFYIYAYNKLFIGVVEGDSMEHYLLHNSNVINRQGYHLRLEPKQHSIQFLLLLSGDIETCPGPSFAEFTKMRGMKIIHQNIRGLFHNISHFSAVLEKYNNIDIITLSETHIRLHDNIELFSIPGYRFISKPRLNGFGGGVGMDVFDNFLKKC